MTLAGQSFEMYTNNTVRLVVPVRDGVGSTKDLTDATVEWVMYKGDTTYISKATGDGITLSDPTTVGQFTVSLAPADSVSLVAGEYLHEAKVTDAAGDEATVLVGTVTVRRSRL